MPVAQSELREKRRLVPIPGNPAITLKQPKTAPGDLVALDLRVRAGPGPTPSPCGQARGRTAWAERLTLHWLCP